MVETHELPEGVDENYENTEARAALLAFQAAPDYEHLAAFLNALREGFLVVDVTGTSSKKKGPRVRTIRSTKGQLVLPIFTSMAELRALAPQARGEEVKGAIMPARAALSLIKADRFVAAEFDKASASLVCLRKFILLALEYDEVTAESLQA
ncbi:SseB family protein [Leucobacter sp. BZR 635]